MLIKYLLIKIIIYILIFYIRWLDSLSYKCVTYFYFNTNLSKILYSFLKKSWIWQTKSLVYLCFSMFYSPFFYMPFFNIQFTYQLNQSIRSKIACPKNKMKKRNQFWVEYIFFEYILLKNYNYSSCNVFQMNQCKCSLAKTETDEIKN